MHKPQFSNLAYELFDQKAKDVIINYINKKTKFTVKENPDKYGIDLLLYRDNILIGGVEVEVKSSFTDRIKFKTVHIPKRKRKFFNNDNLNLFIMLNNDYSKFLLISGKKILNSKVVSKDTVRGWDNFFEIPLEEFKEYAV